MCKCPHVFFFTSLHLSMITTQLHRTRIPMSLLRILSEQAKARIATAVNWAYPSFLLSLLLVNLYAQIHDAKSYCVCWHLIPSQLGWDEGKGLCPLVYEDNLSETRSCSLLFFGLVPIFSLLCCHWVLLLLQNAWSAQQRLWIIFLNDMLAKNWLSTLGRFLSELTFFACSINTGSLPSYLLKKDM